MNLPRFMMTFCFFLFSSFSILHANQKTIAYLVSDISIPFWSVMANGIKNVAHKNGYNFVIYDGKNQPKKELEQTIQAIKDNVSGIIVSPTNSSACVTILKLAKSANIPVVIADIGTDAGEYVTYVSSNNKEGAYNIGKVLAKKMVQKGWQDGTVGIIAIPQKRLNGQARTAGFMKALDEAEIKGTGIKQFIKWDNKETYNYVKELIHSNPNLRAIWLQTSHSYQAAINAIKDSNKQNDIFLIFFDAEPEFLDLIPKGTIIGSAMQQPFLMGEKAALALTKHLKGEKVNKDLQQPILIISTDNIQEKLPIINRNVLGIIKE